MLKTISQILLFRLNSSDELKEEMIQVVSDNTCIQKDLLSVPVSFKKGSRNLAMQRTI